MKRKKNPNISAMVYERDFDLTYECVLPICCKFTLCEIMPPSEESTCCFCDHGACRSHEAQKAALTNLRSMINGALRQLEEDGQ